MKFLLLLLLLMGCGKKIIYTYPPVPENQASPIVKAEIDEELEKIQAEFAEIDVQVNLKSLPVVVAPLPFGVVGRCQYGEKDRGIYIILSPHLFIDQVMLPLDAPIFEKDFVRVLLHEIGHCYFRRQHEEPAYLEIPGQSFELQTENAFALLDKIPTSLMPAESAYRMPKALRKYYVAEIAGKAPKLTSPTVLGLFAEFSVVENKAVVNPPEKSDTVETTQEDGCEIPEFLEATWTQDPPKKLGNF